MKGEIYQTMQLKWFFQVLNWTSLQSRETLTLYSTKFCAKRGFYQFLCDSLLYIYIKIIIKKHTFFIQTSESSKIQRVQNKFSISETGVQEPGVSPVSSAPSVKQFEPSFHSCILLFSFSSILYVPVSQSSVWCTFCMSGINVTMHGPRFAFRWCRSWVCSFTCRQSPPPAESQTSRNELKDKLTQKC